MREANQNAEKPALEKIIILPKPKTLINASFTDHRGKPFNHQQFKGHWSIVFFGFTHCPDICPTTMHTLKQVKSNLEAADLWGNYQVIMITVDPQRDSVEKLAAYVPFFDSEFIGLASDVATTTEFAKQLGILFVATPPVENGSYDVDHSAALILINPEGKMAGVITAPHDVIEISNDLKRLANFYADDHVLSSKTKSLVSSESGKKANDKDSRSDPTAAEQLKINNAWIRPAPASAESMAGYMELVNQTDHAITIVGADSPQFDMSMIHDSIVENGISSMRHRDKLLIPANGSVVLSPGATHLMLMRPESALSEGQFVEINFATLDDEEITFKVEVRDEPSQNANPVQ